MSRIARNVNFIASILIIAACSKPEPVNPILDEWKFSNVSLVSYDPSQNYDAPCKAACVTITFNSDLTYAQSNGAHGKYVLNGNQIKIGGFAPAVFTIAERNLILVWNTTPAWDWGIFTEKYTRP